MTRAPLWIGEDDVAELLSLTEAIDVLAEAHRGYHAGAGHNMVRTHASDGEAILHAVGGIDGGVAGTKTWIHTAGGAQPRLVLFSAVDGSVLAIIEAFLMGQLRTAGTCGLATQLLAREDATTLAIFGTGKQALPQVRAVAAVRPIRRVRVFGRDPGRRAGFAQSVADELGVEVSDFADAAATLDGADVATLITRAAEPFISAEMLPAGIHVNAAGAIVKSRRELHSDAVAAFDLIAVDSLAQARQDAGELLAAESAGLSPWPHVRELGELVAESVSLRADERTLLKALGVGIADVAIGAELLRRAHEHGVGRLLPGLAEAHH